MREGDLSEGTLRHTGSADDLVLPAFQKRSQAARDRLLEAAEREFARRGFNGAIVSDLAREANCSVGSFYRRFKDKEALFFALQQTIYERASRDIDRFFDNPRRADMPLRPLFGELVVNTYRGMNAIAGYFRAFVELAHGNVGVWSRMTELEAQQGRRLAALVVARGHGAMSEERCWQGHLATRAVNSFVITNVLYRPEGFSPIDPPVVEQIAEIFHRGMGLPHQAP